MGLVKPDDPFEIITRPVDELLQTAMIATGRTKRRIGDEEHTLIERYRLIDLPVGKWLDIGRKPSERRPVPACVFEQRLVLRDPDVAAPAREPVIENAGRDLPPLPRAGSVT